MRRIAAVVLSLLGLFAFAAPATAAAATDPYDVKLRSDASPKTRETFEQLKTIAKQREDAALADAATAKQSLSELQTKVAELEKRTVPDDVKTELEELRQFRAQFDTQNDPAFRQKFDSRIDGNYSTIYAKLLTHGLPQSEIDKVKAYAPADRDANIENWIAKLPSMDKKYIEAKLLDNINVADERERALQEARGKANEILAAKKDAPVQATAQRDAAVASILRPVLDKLPWIHVQPIAQNAAPEDRKRIEGENKFALEMQDALKRSVVDDSPATRAEAALAVPLAHHFRAQFLAAQAKLEALQKKLDGISAASSTSRIARSTASSAAPAKQVDPNKSGEEAIDELFNQLTGNR